jgi:HD-GYP domain-containing protein (c-di-GMP phosphodiesterase class II)
MGDMLELVEQLGGLLLDRPERKGFSPEDALQLIKDRNLKGFNNRFLKAN